MRRHDGVQIRIGARVDRVEENQENFRLGHANKRITGQSRNAEKRNGRPRREVGEHQQSELLRHRHFVAGLVAQA